MITKRLPHLERAINEESWQYLETQFPLFADAIQKEVLSGATPDDIRRGMQRRGKSPEMVQRAEQAARYLTAVADNDDLPERWEALQQ